MLQKKKVIPASGSPVSPAACSTKGRTERTSVSLPSCTQIVALDFAFLQTHYTHKEHIWNSLAHVVRLFCFLHARCLVSMVERRENRLARHSGNQNGGAGSGYRVSGLAGRHSADKTGAVRVGVTMYVAQRIRARKQQEDGR